MADIDPTTLRDSEIGALLDRMTARADSMVLRDMPQLQSDIRLIVRFVRVLLAAREANNG